MREYVYEFPSNDMGNARRLLEEALGAQLEAHESFHWGGDYYLYKDDSQEMRLFFNRDFEDEPIYEEMKLGRLAFCVCAERQHAEAVADTLGRMLPSLKLVLTT